MNRKNVKFKFIFTLLAVLLLFTACERNTSENPGNESLEPLSIEELSLDWIDTQALIEDLEQEQKYLAKETLNDGMYLTYTMEHYEYMVLLPAMIFGIKALLTGCYMLRFFLMTAESYQGQGGSKSGMISTVSSGSFPTKRTGKRKLRGTFTVHTRLMIHLKWNLEALPCQEMMVQ